MSSRSIIALCALFCCAAPSIVPANDAADAPAAAERQQDAAALKQAVTDYNIGRYSQAFKGALPLAEKGGIAAMILVGRMYESGLGVLQDQVTGVDWYRRAADAGSVEAMVLMGYCCKLGTGTVKDGAAAFMWMQKAADLGSPDAQFELAMMLNAGKIVDRNDELAFAWAEKAALQGNPEAQRFVGACYAHGAGVAKDEVKAKDWLAKADAQGYSTEGSVTVLPEKN